MDPYHDAESEDLHVMSSDSPSLDLSQEDHRDEINLALFDILEPAVYSPEMGYLKINRVFHEIGYDVPYLTTHSQADGEDIYGIESPDGTLLCYLYVAFFKNVSGTFEVHAELVTESELNEILEDADY